MRKLMAMAAAVVLFQGASAAWADGISFSINVGGPPIVVSQPPEFLYPPELGFGVAVGVPYDMFYLGGVYYINRGGGWYRTSVIGGPWIKVGPRGLPPEFRRYNMGRIHEFRDREYRVYARDRGHYRGKYFRPGGGGREEHRDMREQRHEGHGEKRDERRDEHHDEHGGERR
jgi:hypothetical protein